MYKIAPFNGGGLLGVGVGKCLQLIARDTNKEPRDYFDCFIGTSTGSIIASLLAIDYTGCDIMLLYRELGDQIFSKRNLIPIFSKYDNRPLEKLLKKTFGERTFNSISKPLYISCYDHYLKKAWLFSKKNSGDMPLWRAVLISCSAPTFFPPIDRRWSDGGTILQNPTVYGTLQYCKDYKIGLGELSVMSFDTDGSERENSLLPKRVTPLQWAMRIIDSAIDGSDNTTADIAELMPYHRYIRLTPIVKDIYPMDNPKIMGDYMGIWHNYYNRIKDDILGFMNQ